MQIRAVGEADLPTLCALRLEFLAEVRDLDPATLAGDFERATVEFVTGATTRGDLHSWIAEHHGVPMGVVSLLLTPAPPLPEDGRTTDGLVLTMYVRPGDRRRGAAAALLGACTAGARRLGVRRLALYATEAGRPLYLGAGFLPNDDWLEIRLP